MLRYVPYSLQGLNYEFIYVKNTNTKEGLARAMATPSPVLGPLLQAVTNGFISDYSVLLSHLTYTFALPHLLPKVFI